MRYYGESGIGKGEERRVPRPVRIPVEDRIDLHAFPPGEIRHLVEEYLEEAARAGFRLVRIIHGKGTGAQRRSVRSVLSRHPLVESFGDAPPEAGGWGATVIALRPAGRPTSDR
ncbi:MAG: Smr/MutS family protein [Deltaproteobacteria bacterium]|nr:Smr/MutS family protein [Deltaproteobacteria bacterium]